MTTLNYKDTKTSYTIPLTNDIRIIVRTINKYSACIYVTDKFGDVINTESLVVVEHKPPNVLREKAIRLDRSVYFLNNQKPYDVFYNYEHILHIPECKIETNIELKSDKYQLMTATL